jgi:hypothetical protein
VACVAAPATEARCELHHGSYDQAVTASDLIVERGATGFRGYLPVAAPAIGRGMVNMAGLVVVVGGRRAGRRPKSEAETGHVRDAVADAAMASRS